MNQNTPTQLLYLQEQLPIFQNRMYDSAREAMECPKGDMVLVEDQQTGLIYNAAFRPELMGYDRSYQNEQALSPLFRKHLQSVLAIVNRCLGRESLVEIGCGKGFFLEMLLESGADAIGCDPAYEGKNPRVLKQYFQPGLAVQAKGLILRHVLEHVHDPFSFLLHLKQTNGGGGKIYIEVPCFDWICAHRAWFDVFYEHVNYFRASDFQRMFGTIFESGRLFGGQYLFVVADLASLRQPELNPQDRVKFPPDFSQIGTTSGANLNASIIWGGASKGVIFALLMQRAGRPVSTVIDINPAKQGKYLPATGILVQAPQRILEVLPRGATIFVMNSNYLDEIREMSKNQFNYVAVD